MRPGRKGAAYAKEDRGGQEGSFDRFTRDFFLVLVKRSSTNSVGDHLLSFVNWRFHTRLLFGDEWMFCFPALEDDPGNGEPDEQQVQHEVLPPGEPFDDAAAGTGDIGKTMEKDNERIAAKEPHQDQGAIKTGEARAFEDQGQG